MFSDWLLKYVFRVQEHYIVFLGTKRQKGCNFVVVKTKGLWKREPLNVKILSIIKLKWYPTELAVKINAKECFMDTIFGEPKDYAEELYTIMTWHNSRDWEFSFLTEMDDRKSQGIEGLTALTRLRFLNEFKNFNLNLAEHFPLMCILTYPMVAKIPIISIQYYVDVHCNFAFNSIRKSKHAYADDIVSYLYEIAFLQQKIASSLHEYINLIRYTEDQKKEALFMSAEVNAIMGADAVFSYLKASIEKIIALIGLTHNIPNLDSKKTHKAKVEALIKGLPPEVSKQYYSQFILECIKSENLAELNSYRSGLLHKRGISDLQPHNFVGEKAEAVPLKKIFLVLHEQHVENSAILLGALAILTDELIRIDPPLPGLMDEISKLPGVITD